MFTIVQSHFERNAQEPTDKSLLAPTPFCSIFLKLQVSKSIQDQNCLFYEYILQDFLNSKHQEFIFLRNWYMFLYLGIYLFETSLHTNLRPLIIKYHILQLFLRKTHLDKFPRYLATNHIHAAKFEIFVFSHFLIGFFDLTLKRLSGLNINILLH